MNEVNARRARLQLGWVGIPSRAVTSQLGQLSLASLRGKGGNVTSAGWQVILCDPIRHVSSRSGEASCELLYSVYLLPLPSHTHTHTRLTALFPTLPM